jgi:hypothetical protein
MFASMIASSTAQHILFCCVFLGNWADLARLPPCQFHVRRHCKDAHWKAVCRQGTDAGVCAESDKQKKLMQYSACIGFEDKLKGHLLLTYTLAAQAQDVGKFQTSPLMTTSCMKTAWSQLSMALACILHAWQL